MYGWDPRGVLDALGVLGGVVGESGVPSSSDESPSISMASLLLA
jgi:hypothetical protein